MKVLLLSTYDSDGGAARASYRILKEVIKRGINASMLVRTKRTDDFRVLDIKGKYMPFFNFFAPYIDQLPVRWYKNRKLHFWNVGWLKNNSLQQEIAKLNPDILQLHWVSEGYVPIKLLERISIPIIWRLSDSWAFTGGCHVPFNCHNYMNDCGNCPQLNSGKVNDLSRRTWKKKNKYWKNCNLTIVTPSNWMAECVRKSSLFNSRPVKVIFPGVDINIFLPRDKIFIKQTLNLDVNKRYIVFGAIKATDDINKGFNLLKEALLLLKKRAEKSDEIEILILGASEPSDEVDLGFKCNYMGRINDEITMALYYSVAEVFVLPSLIDNSPNTVIEAMACGIPTVAFGACGVLDMIDHNVNGYLAKAYDVNDLCNGIDWIVNIATRAEYNYLAEKARIKVIENFNIEKIAEQYTALYDTILTDGK